MPQYHKGYNRDKVYEDDEPKKQKTIDEFGKIDKEDNDRFLYGQDKYNR